jgi:glycosyltransferase involved in cell wall biosynthesis
VPTYNRKEYLCEAILALQNQSRPVDEIIVWDDGSSDGTDKMISALQIPNLTYVHAENAGKCAALNGALSHATGDYIWICDDDDIALPHAAEKLAVVLDVNPDIGISGGGYERFRDTDNGQERSGPGYWPDLSNGTPLRHLLEDIYLFQNATMVQRSCYDAVGPFNENLVRSIDYDMIVRLAIRFPLHMSEDVLFLQRKHDGDRGPASARHSIAKVESVWSAQDRVVFQGLRDKIPITLIAAMFDGDETQVLRAAYIQRATIFARHDLWDFAIDDLQRAEKLGRETPLGPLEFAMCRRAVSGKQGVRIDSNQLRRLKDLSRSSLIGDQIARSLGRGLIWSIRKAVTDRDFATMMRLGATLTRTGLKMKPDPTGSDVNERQQIPLTAYK